MSIHLLELLAAVLSLENFERFLKLPRRWRLNGSRCNPRFLQEPSSISEAGDGDAAISTMAISTMGYKDGP